MPGRALTEITALLTAWRAGDEAALAELTTLVYGELHRLARHYMAQERRGHTLQATALVHEAFVRLVDRKNVDWQNRAHFFGIAAQLMRQILVDFARSRRYAKRGGGAVQVPLDENLNIGTGRTGDLVAIDEALTALAALDERQAKVVEMRFFGGLTHEQIAEVLGVSAGTVRRDWSLARAWLYGQLATKGGRGGACP